METYGTLTIKLKIKGPVTRDNESELFNKSSELFNDIERYIEIMKPRYPMFAEIEVIDED